mgnify:CR=1 FL=1|tara:strand:+ start:45 stop:788 length:744 start_codon:yes stop_codon:yes gene_type:complete
MDLNGKVIFVTGGNRGIGKSIVESFCNDKCKVFFTYKERYDSAALLKKRLSKINKDIDFIQLDVVNKSSINKAYKRCFDKFGKIDVLVNNAGINKPTDFNEIEEDDWDEILSINLKGPFLCSQLVIDYMVKDGGSIIHIGSVSGQYGGPRTAHYAASKAGLISLSQVIARYSSKFKIRSNVVAAGLIESEMASSGLKNKSVQNAFDTIIAKRMGEPNEVAEVVKFLASDKSSYITAQTINVNGGLYF